MRRGRDAQVSLWDVIDNPERGHVRDMRVHRVHHREVVEFCERWHYANRGGNMSWCYGLSDGPVLVGVVAYNLPTMPACSSFFGPERWAWVAHMGRLVCADDTPRNVESRLIAGSLRLLQDDRAEARLVVSYAAPSAGHLGYIYQATNALYLGMTAPTHYYVDHLGARRAPKQGVNLSIAKAIARGWTVHREPGKHRYAYLLGNKTQRREARRLLRYPVLPYPKHGCDDYPTEEA